jgi:hypothetical protein
MVETDPISNMPEKVENDSIIFVKRDFFSWYKAESVNRSQMDIKRTTYGIRTCKNIYFSTYPPPTLIQLSRRFISASKPATSKSFDCYLSHFRTWSDIICDFRMFWREFLDPVVNRFTRQTLPIVNRKHFFMNIFFLHWVLLPTKSHNIKLLFGSTSLKLGRYFDYWNQPMNMRMAVCYLDCHEAGLCCYLVIHIENQLHPLQLFCFHLWPIYWLSLIV